MFVKPYTSIGVFANPGKQENLAPAVSDFSGSHEKNKKNHRTTTNNQ